MHFDLEFRTQHSESFECGIRNGECGMQFFIFDSHSPLHILLTDQLGHIIIKAELSNFGPVETEERKHNKTNCFVVFHPQPQIPLLIIVRRTRKYRFFLVGVANVDILDLSVEPEWSSIRVIDCSLSPINSNNYLTFLIAGGTQRPSNACASGS